MTEYLTEYLTVKEYRCRHCNLYPPDLFIHDIKGPYLELFNIFDGVRATWGQPLHVSSGYRCPYHNTQIGGSPCSLHMFGLALDVDLATVEETEELFALLEMDFPHLRIGKYADTKTFIHFDIGYLVTPRASHNWVRGARW